MASKRNRVKAVAYMRTSSPTNVGEDKDSEKRQRKAIKGFAKSGGYVIADEDWFYDAAVSGADLIEDRKGFAALLSRIESNGVRTVIVEDVGRFARELMTQEQGIVALINLGVKVMTASGDDLTQTDDPMRVAFRQMAGVFVQLEKTRLVQKLRVARERKRAANGKCEGRKSHAESNPKAVALAKAIKSRGLRVSLRQIAAELEGAGYVNKSGKRFAAKSVMKMLVE
jgi:DNA invertase Pin-like site-specific DNA recombinase